MGSDSRARRSSWWCTRCDPARASGCSGGTRSSQRAARRRCSDVMPRIDERELARGVRALARRDADLRRIVERLGPPPLWAREPGFPTLVQIILEQQVSLASGRAAYARLLRAAGRMTPRRVALLRDADLAGAGLTRQKSAYVRGIAQAIVRGELDLGH